MFTALTTLRTMLLPYRKTIDIAQRLSPSLLQLQTSPHLSFSCDSHKIDDFSPRAAWARLKMHEVMRANFSTPPPLHLSPPSHFLHRWQEPPLLGGVSHLRVPQVVSGRLSVMYEDRRRDSMMNDGGEQPRLECTKNRGSHRYYDAWNRRRGKKR